MHDPARQQTISLQTMSLFDDKPRIRVLLRVVRSATHFLKYAACCSPAPRQDTREHTSALSGKVFALVLDAEKVRWELACLETCTAALSSRIAGIERFKRPRSLANYFGLTPGCRNSGEKKDRLGRITKAGSSIARWVLGQASKHILRTI